MKITTQRQLIQNVAAKFREQYKAGFSPANLIDNAKILKKLDALDGNTASAEDVSKITGNALWTRLTCDECSREVDAVITVGQEPDYESATASLCFNCVNLANQLKEAVMNYETDLPQRRDSDSPPCGTGTRPLL